MFVIKVYKEIFDKGGKVYYVDRKIIKKIVREDMQGTDYDFSDVNFWGKQIAKMKTDSGKLLPIKDKYGQRFVYEVTLAGSPAKWMRPYLEHIIGDRKRGSVCLFPSYQNGVKLPMGMGSIEKYR